MFIKQLSVYRLNPETAPSVDKLEMALAKSPFSEVTGLDWYSLGFVPPHDFGHELVFQAANTWSVSLKKQERILPNSVIKDAVEQKITHIVQNECRPVGRKERIELKEQVIDELLPRALCRSSRLMAMCHVPSQLLLIGSASSHVAENMLSNLREALGGLDAKLPHTKQSLMSLMTEWVLASKAAGNFELDDSCQLTGVTRFDGLIKISHKLLSDEDVVIHVKNGLKVKELGLIWREQIAFVLTEDFKLKRICFLDTLQEKAESQSDDAASLAFASQVIAAESLSKLIHELVAILGGWEE
ncbi:recombination-associated protein RdgC [Kingella kingae]|uniref:recombination-associated protein RdgC n=1 Tax=Kingella kingae TaxID=504 RepID=UPI0003F54B0E|nr:recombination-associated protein RdgC [Kingella kingae]MDK4624197.1 recombination-associated protein RdgC [Kingella kingae]